MAKDNNPAQPNDGMTPAQQTGETQGKIKAPQQTDSTMAEKDLARGSETDTRGSSGRRRKA
jgi:hypothetical protein